jgi:hypothetical protein
VRKHFWYSCLIVVLIILSACSTRSTVTPEPPPTDLPAESIFGPGTLTLSLPSGWDVSSETIRSDPDRPYDLYLLGQNPTESGGPGLSRVVIASASEWTAEEFAISQCSTCPLNAFEPATVAGKPALRTQIGGGDVPILITWYFVENKGHLIAFAIHDPQTLMPLEEVINSIQFQ